MLASLLCLIGIATGLGVEPKVRQLSEPTYNFNRETFLYDQLAFGNQDELIKFMRTQVSRLQVGLYQEDGSGYIGPIMYRLYKEIGETLEELILRASRDEFKRAVTENHYRMNQRFSIYYAYMNSANGDQFYDEISFTPEKSGNTYDVPSSILDSVNLKERGDQLSISWGRIVRATLTVFDPQNGSLVYKGDSINHDLNDPDLTVFRGSDLGISKRFLTNGYTGTLTVACADPHGFANTSMYLIKDGSLVTYPQGIRPLLGIAREKGQIKVNVMSGAPFQNISLLRYTNLDLPPHEELLTLDCVGSAIWTNAVQSSSIGFYKLTYGEQ